MANKEYNLMDDNGKAYVVFSVFQGHRVDWASHKVITDLLEFKNISFKELDGCYKGIKEKSIIMSLEHYPIIKDMLKEVYNQESVLILETHKHGLYKASVEYLADNMVVSIGFLRSAPEHVALLQDAWSYDATQDKYFIVTDSDTTKLNEVEKLYAGLRG